jgi:hypothetical protein
MTTARATAWEPVWWMTGTAAAAWLMASAAAGGRINPEALLGVLGPLVSADASWVIMARAFAADPGRLMGVMVQALAVKMVLFGVYVGVLLGLLDLRPLPFVLSFAGTFVVLHAMEAMFLRRLLKDGARSPDGGRARRYDGSITR